MDTVERTFALSQEVSDKLDEVIPADERSYFVQKTIESAIKNTAKDSFLDFLERGPIVTNYDGPPSEVLVRELREGREKELLSRMTPVER